MRRCDMLKIQVPTPKVKVSGRSEVKLCLKLCCSKTTLANLMKLHRKIKHNEKVFPAQRHSSNDGSQNIFIWRTMANYPLIITVTPSYVEHCYSDPKYLNQSYEILVPV